MFLEIPHVVLVGCDVEPWSTDHRGDGCEHAGVAQREVPGEVAATADPGREDPVLVQR